jgi:hypothetical protein
MTLDNLRALIASGNFHHATVKVGQGRCWDGLYIYEKEANGFNGFKLAGSFAYGWENTEDPLMTAAYEIVKHTGVSFGSYGRG